jgi:hypothetical protein
MKVGGKMESSTEKEFTERMVVTEEVSGKMEKELASHSLSNSELYYIMESGAESIDDVATVDMLNKSLPNKSFSNVKRDASILFLDWIVDFFDQTGNDLI